MAVVNDAPASRKVKPGVFKFKSARREGSLRVAEFALKVEDARALIQRTARTRHLQVNGFRPGRSPALVIYRHFSKTMEASLIGELDSARPAKLNEMLRSCATVPEYRVLPWDGVCDLIVQVSFHVIPGIPSPGGQLGGAAAANEDPELAAPAPGAGVNVADLIPAQVSEQLRRHGLVTGAQLQAAPGPAPLQSAAPGLRLPTSVESDVLGLSLPSVGDASRPSSWETKPGRPEVETPSPEPTAPTAQATSTPGAQPQARGSVQKNEALKKSLAEIKEELASASNE